MGPYHELVHKNKVNTRNKKYANFIMKCMECVILFFNSFFYVGFSFWNIGETGLEMQTEVQEKAGPRWALLGLGQTHGSASPSVAPLALSFLCGASLGVVCCVEYVLLPHTCLLPAILFNNTRKQNSTGLKTGELIFLFNYQIWGHITI